MQHMDPQLEIASRVLTTLISQNTHRELAARADDIRHSLEVAEELIRVRGSNAAPTCELTPRLAPAPKTQEQKVEREHIPFAQLVKARRPEAPAKTPRAPTLH